MSFQFLIIDGLSLEYDTFITSVTSRTDPYMVDEIESLLLAQEARIEKNNQFLDCYPSADFAA